MEKFPLLKKASFDIVEQVAKRPVLTSLIFGGLGGAAGYLNPSEDHKLRNTLIGAGLGAAGGFGVHRFQKGLKEVNDLFYS